MRNIIENYLENRKVKKQEGKELKSFVSHPLFKVVRLKETSIILSCFGTGINAQGIRVLTWNSIVVFRETKKISLKKYLQNLYRDWKKSKKPIEDFMNIRVGKFSDEVLNSIKKFKLTLKEGSANVDLIDEAGFIVFRGTRKQLDKYVKFLNLPILEKRKLLDEAKANIAADPKKKPYKLSRKNAKKYNIPISKVGVTPDFKGLKMFLNETGTLGKKGVKGLPKGLTQAQVDDALEKIIKFDGEVRTNITGLIREVDFANSWKAMGIDPTIGIKIKEHYKLTWHHMDDLDENLQSGMQLVLTSIHDATIPHIGSHAQIKELLNLL